VLTRPGVATGCSQDRKEAQQQQHEIANSSYNRTVGKMRNCGKRKVKCGMETVERWRGTVGKMRKFAYVGDRWSTVNFCEWTCCTLVVRGPIYKISYDNLTIILG